MNEYARPTFEQRQIAKLDARIRTLARCMDEDRRKLRRFERGVVAFGLLMDALVIALAVQEWIL